MKVNSTMGDFNDYVQKNMFDRLDKIINSRKNFLPRITQNLHTLTHKNYFKHKFLKPNY